MNKAILMGRLVRDPELRTTASNLSVCTFTIAVDRRFKSEKGDSADFIPVVAWRQQAEFINRYFSKGSKIVVVGSIQTRSYENKEGKKQYITEVIAEEIHFAESKRDSSKPNNMENQQKPYDISEDDAQFDGEIFDTGLPFDL